MEICQAPTPRLKALSHYWQHYSFTNNWFIKLDVSSSAQIFFQTKSTLVHARSDPQLLTLEKNNNHTPADPLSQSWSYLCICQRCTLFFLEVLDLFLLPSLLPELQPHLVFHWTLSMLCMLSSLLAFVCYILLLEKYLCQPAWWDIWTVSSIVLLSTLH